MKHPADLRVSQQLKERKVRRQAADRAVTEQQERRYQTIGFGTRPVKEAHVTWIDLVPPGPAVGSHTRDRSGIAYYREHKDEPPKRKGRKATKKPAALVVQGGTRALKRREARAEASRPVPDLMVDPRGTRAQRRAKGIPSKRQVALATDQTSRGAVMAGKAIKLLMRNRGGRGA